MSLSPDLAEQMDAEIASTKEFSFDMEKFKKALGAGDQISTIIRGHLYIEHVILQSLNEAFAVPDVLDLRRLNFPAKVDLCIALGLFPSLWRDALLKANEMRNRAAHRIDAEFDDSAKEDFWRTFPEFLQDAALSHKNLPRERFLELRLPSLFAPLILWLDISRQRAAARRIRERFSVKDLERAVAEVHARFPDLLGPEEANPKSG